MNKVEPDAIVIKAKVNFIPKDAETKFPMKILKLVTKLHEGHTSSNLQNKRELKMNRWCVDVFCVAVNSASSPCFCIFEMLLHTLIHIIRSHSSLCPDTFGPRCDYVCGNVKNNSSSPALSERTCTCDDGLMLCLLVTPLESLICRFVDSFPSCWQRSEWLRRSGQAFVFVAFRAVRSSERLCFWSRANRDWLLSVNLSPPCFCLRSSGEGIGRRSVRAKVTSEPAGFPSGGSRSQLWAAEETQQGGTACEGTRTPLSGSGSDAFVREGPSASLWFIHWHGEWSEGTRPRIIPE